jgi:hypothetical protein
LRRQLCETDAADEGIQTPDVEAVTRECPWPYLQAGRLVEPPRQVLANADARRAYDDTVLAITPQLPKLGLDLRSGSSVERLALAVLEAQLS